MLTSLATCWAANNYPVHLYDPDENRREEASQYFEENKAVYCMTASTKFAQVILCADLESTVCKAWHVIECAPENLNIKQKIFAELQALCAPNSIISANSSSYRSSVLSEKVGGAVKRHILNTHYFMPPHVRAVELMTNGSTAPDIFPFLVERIIEVGLQPFVVNKESTGFIQNRVWAAIKGEMLQVVAEGVTNPQTADDIFFETIVRPGTRPFAAMDRKSATSDRVSRQIMTPLMQSSDSTPLLISSAITHGNETW
jgi:3-hydroxyacyl-CoA dehydrogenase